MKPILCFAASLLFAINVYSATWHVQASSAGANTGTNWADAFTDLQSALSAASFGDEIWVAAGTYLPTTGSSRTVSFVMKNGVAVYGGFNGTETLRSQRDFNSNATILSGNIGSPGSQTDNTHRIVTAQSVNNLTILDGFQLKDGYNTHTFGSGGPDFESSGAAFFNVDGSPTIANCKIFNNYCLFYGAAVSHRGTGTLTLRDCEITYNNANTYAGALYLSGDNSATLLNVINCNISNNSAGTHGGAIHVYEGTLNIDRCIFSGNSAGGDGGAISTERDEPIFNIYNSLIVGNVANHGCAISMPGVSISTSNIVNTTIAHNKSQGSGGLESAVAINDDVNIHNCILWGNDEANELPLVNLTSVKNSVVEGGLPTGTNILNQNPQFVNPGSSLVAPFDAANYDYRLIAASPAIDAGNNSYILSIYNADLDNLPRTHGSIVDMGSYENDYCALTANINASGATSICDGDNVTLTASGGTDYLWSTGSASPSIVATDAGDYSVTVTDNGGCRGSGSQEVVVLQASVVITGDTVVCSGNSETLTASGTNISTYNWSTGGNSSSVTVSTGGIVSVTITTNDGCSATDAISLTQASAPAPVVSMNGSVLETGSFAAYQWYFDGGIINGAISNQYTPTQNGAYSVQVTNTAGCTGTSADFNLTNVGISESEKMPVRSYYSSENALLILTNTGNQQTEYLRVNILTIDGRLLSSHALGFDGNKQVKIDVSHFPAGTYVANITTGKVSESVKFLKSE